MALVTKLGALALVAVALSGCGEVAADTMLLGNEPIPQKIPCPGNHEGFYVCMQAVSKVDEAALKNVMLQALGQLAVLVNGDEFQEKIEAAFTNGQSIVSDLTSTNYMVRIDSYCEKNSDTLAEGVLEGDSIKYNECTVRRGADGTPDLAQVSGVLLHEISHNLGYTHPKENPSRLTIPYYLGDTIEKMLGGDPDGSSASYTDSNDYSGSDGYYGPSGSGTEHSTVNGKAYPGYPGRGRTR